MSRLSNWLSRACSELGLRADLAFTVTLPNGRQIPTVMRIANLGAAQGMLVVRGYDDVRENANVLLAAGYAYSVLDEPYAEEQFSLESYREMFSDWGWSGSPDQKPHWMQ